MPSHKAVHVKSAGAALELAEVETTPPARGEVRISVGACGICGTDAHFVAGEFPGMSWPLTLTATIARSVARASSSIV
jgi:D-arabinose 1-dehydrogenase-like Zn-dependent alcohol dehydrogenase